MKFKKWLPKYWQTQKSNSTFTSPTFKLSFEGQTSFSLDKNTTDYFARLQSIVPFPVSVSKENSTRWKVVFAPSAGNVPSLQLSSGSGYVETIQDGNDLGGTFTLKYMESVTEAISCDARPEEIKSKVNAILPSFRSIEVEKLASSKHRHEWLITFPSEMGDIGMLIEIQTGYEVMEKMLLSLSM